jgi:transcriptional regulator with XRE-family HTH domain
MISANNHARTDSAGDLGALPNVVNSAFPLNRLRTVRRREGISRRTVARRLQRSVEEVALQEEEPNDLLLSTLYQWASALEVPVTELLVEPNESLSPSVMKRAQAVRLMKTAKTILERGALPIRRMAQMLIDQLIEMMPELKDTTAWPAVGQRRDGSDLGRIAERVVSTALFRDARND